MLSGQSLFEEETKKRKSVIMKQRNRKMKMRQKRRMKRRPHKKYLDQEKMNKTKLIWIRKPDGITQKGYGEFCKGLTMTGKTTCQSSSSLQKVNWNSWYCFFIPLLVPLSALKTIKKIELYVMWDHVQLWWSIPEHLHFIRGTVYSVHLPLSISQEMLQ